ncbi:hypothetical protein [Nocardia anaemiae]|uniref:hypothetical protein n=1 Tax=Nocardia anaemiae TaxID=263910 RepID=UPI000B1106CF|nr:hypothetical protein [Nocardia anaemiae]
MPQANSRTSAAWSLVSRFHHGWRWSARSSAAVFRPRLDWLIGLRTGLGLDEMSPLGAAASVRVPTFVYQVHDDLMTRPSDVQPLFDAISSDVP